MPKIVVTYPPVELPMNMRRIVFPFASLLLFGLAHADVPLGKYRMRADDSARRQLSKGGSYGILTLKDGNRFVLDTDNDYRRGRYVEEDGRLVLLPSSGGEVRVDVRDGRLSLDGVAFEYDRTYALAERRFPTDASSGRVERERRRIDPVEESRFLPPVVEQPLVFEPPFERVKTVVIPPAAPRPVEPTVAPTRPRLEARQLVGIWTVWRNGLEEKGQRMELKKDGTFRFGMKDASSEGTWTIEDNEIVLIYKKIDGEPLEEGAHGRKVIPIAEDGSAFQIDTFRYERATGK